MTWSTWWIDYMNCTMYSLFSSRTKYILPMVNPYYAWGSFACSLNLMLFWYLFFQTHPTQTCFMSSVDLHTHYSYQVSYLFMFNCSYLYTYVYFVLVTAIKCVIMVLYTHCSYWAIKESFTFWHSLLILCFLVIMNALFNILYLGTL